MTPRGRFYAHAALFLPLLILLLPLVPMLVQLADVNPRGIAILGPRVAAGLAAIIAAGCSISFVAVLCLHGRRAITAAPLMAPLGALIATQIIAGVLGVALRASWFEILSQIGDAVAFLVFWWTMSDDKARRAVLGCFFLSGIAATSFAIALTLSRHPPAAFSYEHGRAAGTFLQPNEFAGYLLFLIPLGIAQQGAPAWLRRVGTIAAAVGVAGLALSVSRAAWIGLLLALPLLAARFGRRVLAAYCVAAVLALVLGATIFRDVAHDPSENTSRITVWRGAVRMAERFALTGVGPIAFSRVYASFKEPDAVADEVHAHDLALNVLIENGILGFAAFVWAVVAGFRAARRSAGRIPASDRERLLLFWALSVAFVASALQNVVDLVSTFVLLLWWPMLGLMLSLGTAAPIGTQWPDAKPFSVARRAMGRGRVRPAGAALLALTLSSGWFASGCNRSTAPSAQKTTSPASLAPSSPAAASPRPAAQSPNYRVSAHKAGGRQITISAVTRGRPVYVLKAGSAVYSTNGKRGTFLDNSVYFYKGSAVRLTLTAPTADLNMATYNVVLRDGVIARNESGVTLKADIMAYNDRSQVLTATGHVNASDDKGDVLSGDRATADLDLQQIHMFNVVDTVQR